MLVALAFQLVFKGCKNLQHLELADANLALCHRLVLLLPKNTNLTLLTINLRNNRLRQIKNKNVAFLDCLLTMPQFRFKTLKEVRFRYFGRSSHDQVSARLLRAFPLLAGERMLNIVSEVSPTTKFQRCQSE